MGKKSNHKHDYEFVEIKDNGWFTHEKKCKVCGHVNDRVRIGEDPDGRHLYR